MTSHYTVPRVDNLSIINQDLVGKFHACNLFLLVQKLILVSKIILIMAH